MGFNAMICTIANHCNVYKLPVEMLYDYCLYNYIQLSSKKRSKLLGENTTNCIIHHAVFHYLYLQMDNKLFHHVIRVLPTGVSHWALFIWAILG